MMFKVIWILIVLASLTACTSNLENRSHSAHLLDEISQEVGVNADELHAAVEQLDAIGGLMSISGVDNAQDLSILACVADTNRDGQLNASDLQGFRHQYGRTCSHLAVEDPEQTCSNLQRQGLVQGDINLEDLSVFALLFEADILFSTDLCHSSMAGDSDGISPYAEARADTDTDPLFG